MAKFIGGFSNAFVFPKNDIGHLIYENKNNGLKIILEIYK